MKSNQILGACTATILVLLATACGSGGASTAADDPSPVETGGRGLEEEITPGGIAVIVLDHLGRDTVRQVITFAGEGEEGSVGVMVQLRDPTPHNFSVSVYPPAEAAEFGLGGCPRQRKGVSSQCRTLENGATVMTSEHSQGFSDDNVDGSLLMGSVITPEDGAAMVMYESYDDSPTVSLVELEDMLTDPRLTWLTDPEVNEAGEAVDLKEVTG